MQHVADKPVIAVACIIAAGILAFAVPYFLKQQRLYGRMFEFASGGRKVTSGLAAITLVSLGLYVMTPYVAPPSNEIAVVLGNTANSPKPSISGEVAESVSATMLMHKGDDASSLIDSVKFVSATKKPALISLSSGLKLREISNNTANAKRDAKLNIEAIEKKLAQAAPEDNGANYLEAIMEARSNVGPGSRIIVIGSGLSDAGDLNFSKDGILIDEDARNSAIDILTEKYGRDYLDGYTVEFYGLGDTAAPQESLSTIQKEVVRTTYKEAVRAIGGDVDINTRTLSGDAIKTDYQVGTTDTGCGDINLIFDDDDLKFVGDKATFIDRTSALKSLSSISEIWNKQKATIQSIQVDGYIAHHPTSPTLSQDRASAVKAALVGLGVSESKITATGKGFGPYETDEQNRAVKVNISRDTKQCSN